MAELVVMIVTDSSVITSQSRWHHFCGGLHGSFFALLITLQGPFGRSLLFDSTPTSLIPPHGLDSLVICSPLEQAIGNHYRKSGIQICWDSSHFDYVSSRQMNLL